MIKHNKGKNVSISQEPRKTYKQMLCNDLRTNKYAYLMILPVLVFYFVFHYIPMFGVVIAFQNYVPGDGFFTGEWVGLKHFKDFFDSIYFGRILGNTLSISFLDIIIGFPAPIILALLLNEVRCTPFKKTVQTITYMPHFISIVIICSMITDFTASKGIINDFLELLGFERIAYLQHPQYFRSVYIISNLWQHVGWSSIVYLSALAAIPQELYEAATIDGANRFQRVVHITIPGIMSTILVLLLLKIGSVMNVSFEKIILLYNPNTYKTADVISSYVYRRGLQEMNFSYTSAIGLFNSLVNFILLVLANTFSKKAKGESIW